MKKTYPKKLYACVSHPECHKKIRSLKKYKEGECIFGPMVTCVCGKETWYWYDYDRKPIGRSKI